MEQAENKIIAGQAVYTKSVLSVYDFIVLSISNRYIWKCPSVVIEDHYNNHISSNHLDVGVGTGYFLDRCIFPSNAPRIALMDMNSNTLKLTSRRIARFNPETYEHNILEQIDTSMESFDSVGLNYLLHCIPGSISEKAIALDHLKQKMNPGATIFGATVLHKGVNIGKPARKLMMLYNKKGIFSNLEDDLSGLNTALSQRFNNISLEVVGCVALFSAKA